MVTDMKVVILCGGEGTRLSEYTVKIPKPLIEIGGKPIIWHIMKIYSHYGYNDFILCLGYKGEKIREYFKNNNHEFRNIIFVDTGLNSNKAERLKRVEKFIEEENFFLAYGDDVSNVNINNILKFHLKNRKIATITAVNLISQYGILKINKKNEIINFKEKPILDYWINGGFFVLNRKIFEHIKDGMELEDDIFKQFASKRQICAFEHKGFWKSMNTLKDVKELNDIWKSGKIPWKVWK
jgi:glucose-1-phosphate cytidylyltransferase